MKETLERNVSLWGIDEEFSLLGLALSILYTSYEKK